MTRYSSWKFTILLTAMVLVLTVRLATAGAVESQFLLDVVGSVMIIGGMLGACAEPRYRTAVPVVGIPAALLTVVGDALPDELSRSTFILTRALGALALGLVVALIIRALLTERNVSHDTIAGAFCGYLLIGIVWTELYCLLAL